VPKSGIGRGESRSRRWSARLSSAKPAKAHAALRCCFGGGWAVTDKGSEEKSTAATHVQWKLCGHKAVGEVGRGVVVPGTYIVLKDDYV
jgi:hypothetical protein